MGSTRLETELSRARVGYLAAARELTGAMAAFDAAHVPIAPTRGGALAPWTREHVDAVLRARNAWVNLADARRAFDALIRQTASAVTRPTGPG